ncbi:nuclear transport factor 2 family protein [Microbispora sp. CA-135349]|uniref:nuclear transport factor 2 family protein n=1 Tax=Microbispora sp. CA-135349 TaxID=3239953 RepID=UPI003D94F60D
MPDPRDLHDVFAAALCAHDSRRLLGCFHPGAVVVTPVGIVEGHEQIEWYFGQFFSIVPDLTTEVTTMLVHGDSIAVEWVTSGSQAGGMPLPDGTEIPGTGHHVRWTGCGMWTVEDDRFVTGRIYYDQLGAYMSLGCRLVRTEPGSAAAPVHMVVPDREAGPAPAAGSPDQEARAETGSGSIRRLLRRLSGR